MSFIKAKLKVILVIFVFSAVSCAAPASESSTATQSSQVDISPEQTQEQQVEMSPSMETADFVDAANVEFIAKFSEEWASILSCKFFNEQDWLSSWTYWQVYDEEVAQRGDIRLLGINQAFDIAIVEQGVTNSRSEIATIKSHCEDVLNYYHEKDKRIPRPISTKEFWDKWEQ